MWTAEGRVDRPLRKERPTEAAAAPVEAPSARATTRRVSGRAVTDPELWRVAVARPARERSARALPWECLVDEAVARRATRAVADPDEVRDAEARAGIRAQARPALAEDPEAVTPVMVMARAVPAVWREAVARGRRTRRPAAEPT
jgi:hypothetical protein